MKSHRLQLFFPVGDGRLGCPEHAPYDAIHVGAAARETPQLVRKRQNLPSQKKVYETRINIFSVCTVNRSIGSRRPDYRSDRTRKRGPDFSPDRQDGGWQNKKNASHASRVCSPHRQGTSV